MIQIENGNPQTYIDQSPFSYKNSRGQPRKEQIIDSECTNTNFKIKNLTLR